MIAPVRRFFMRVCMEPRLLPGVRCSVLNTEYRSPSCWMTMPGRRSVALMLLIFGPVPCLDFGNSRGRPLSEAGAKESRGALIRKTVLSAKSQYKGGPSRGQLPASRTGPWSVKLRYDRSLGGRHPPRPGVPDIQVQEPRFHFALRLLQFG